MSQSQKTGATFTVWIMICAIYFVIPDMGYIAPSLDAIANHYGMDAGQTSYLSTGVALAQIAGALVCGIVVGKYVKHKTMLMISCGFMGVFGMLPALLPEGAGFGILMADRAVFGFFLGFLQPIIFAFIAQMFEDADKRAAGYGVGNVAFNVGAVFATSVGGICVGIGWNTAFWLYAVGLIAMIIVAICYKEPTVSLNSAATESGDEPKEKVKIGAFGWFVISIFCILMILDYPFFTVLVTAVIEHGVCDGVMGGQLMSLFTLVGIVSAAVYGLTFKLLKLNSLPAGFIFAGIGLIMLYAGIAIFHSLPFVIVAVIVLGFGHTTVNTGVPQCVSVVCDPKVASAALAFTAISMNLGVFISSPYMQLVTTIAGTTDYSIVYVVSACLDIVFAIVLFFAFKAQAKKKAASAE